MEGSVRQMLCLRVSQSVDFTAGRQKFFTFSAFYIIASCEYYYNPHSSRKVKLKISQGQTEGHNTKVKHTEMQMFTKLLLVTFGFLIFPTPARIVVFYINFHSSNTNQYFAGMCLFYQIGRNQFVPVGYL